MAPLVSGWQLHNANEHDVGCEQKLYNGAWTAFFTKVTKVMVVVGSNHVATLTGWRQNNVCCNACNVLCHQLFVATCCATIICVATCCATIFLAATCCANNYVTTRCATIFLVATRGKGSVVPPTAAIWNTFHPFSQEPTLMLDINNNDMVYL